MCKPVFRSQIKALASLDWATRQFLVRQRLREDSLLRKYAGERNGGIGLLCALIFLFKPDWDPQRLYGPIFHIGFAMVTAGMASLLWMALFSLFFINPRLKEILDR